MLGPLTLATDAVKYPEFKTEQQARAFLKRCGLLKKTRVLEGKEREKMFTMLKLMPRSPATISTCGAKLGW